MIDADSFGGGAFTVGDLPAWLLHVFYVPGDWLLGALGAYLSAVPNVPGLGAIPAGGPASAVLSAAAWLLLARLVIALCRAARQFDRLLTLGIVRVCTALRQTLRIRAALLGHQLRRLCRRRAPVAGLVVGADLPAMTTRELQVLRLHAGLPPAHALALSEVAAALGLARAEAWSVVSRLMQLRLLASTLTGCDGDDTFVLTRTGQACLVSPHGQAGGEFT